MSRKKLFFATLVFTIVSALSMSALAGSTSTRWMKIYTDHNPTYGYWKIYNSDIVNLGEECESSQITRSPYKCYYYDVQATMSMITAVDKLEVYNRSTCEYDYHEAWWNDEGLSGHDWNSVDFDTNLGDQYESGGYYYYKAWDDDANNLDYSDDDVSLMTVVYEYSDNGKRYQRIFGTGPGGFGPI